MSSGPRYRSRPTLSVTGFYAGYGLVRLQPWAPKWQAIYLVICTIAFLLGAIIVKLRGDSDHPHYAVGALIGFAVVTLPYLPVVFSRWLVRPTDHQGRA